MYLFINILQINFDFDFLHPGKNRLFAEWATFLTNTETFLNRQLKDKKVWQYLQIWRESVNYCKFNLYEYFCIYVKNLFLFIAIDFRNILFITLLHNVLKPSTAISTTSGGKQSTWRASITDNYKIIRERTHIYRTANTSLLFCMLYVGTVENPTNFMFILEENLWYFQISFKVWIFALIYIKCGTWNILKTVSWCGIFNSKFFTFLHHLIRTGKSKLRIY